MSTENVRQMWTRIDEWLRQNASDIAADLRPPVAPEAVAEAERIIGARLPLDVADSLAVHDGQHGSAPWSFGHWRLMSVEHSINQWQLMASLEQEGAFTGTRIITAGNVAAVWWSSGWFPLLSNGSGDYICADVKPPRGGRKGQLIAFWNRSEKREVIAASLTDWLSRYADDLEAGRIGRDENGSLVRIA